MVIGRIALILLTVFSATGCVPEDDGSSPEPASETTGTVTRVVDGDTIEVTTASGDVRVRLAGINAPETDECFGDVATGELSSTLVGETVTLVTTGNDQFDRALAYVSVDGLDLNLDLVRRGLAIATTSGDDSRRREHITAEDEAYTDAIGLWAADACGESETAVVAFDAGASAIDPPGPDDDVLAEESVVIVNNGAASVSLANWILRDESSVHRLVFPPTANLEAGEALVVTSDDARWEPGQGPVWNNGGDMALLQDALGNVVSRWRY